MWVASWISGGWFERGYQSHIICGWLGGVSEGGGGCHHGCHLRAGGMWIGWLGWVFKEVPLEGWLAPWISVGAVWERGPRVGGI